MSDEDQRAAAVKAAATYIEGGMTLGLGSGRAVFALTDLIGKREDSSTIEVVCASELTAGHAVRAGLTVRSLDDVDHVDLALDGADEVDHERRLIKGGGAALLQEKLLLNAADRRIIFCQKNKLVDRLGQTRMLPVEVVIYGWTWTAKRLEKLSPAVTLRHAHGTPVLTDEHDYLLDIEVPDGDIGEFAHSLTDTLGVVEHGLFLTEADLVLLGNDDGSTVTMSKS